MIPTRRDVMHARATVIQLENSPKAPARGAGMLCRPNRPQTAIRAVLCVPIVKIIRSFLKPRDSQGFLAYRLFDTSPSV